MRDGNCHGAGRYVGGRSSGKGGQVAGRVIADYVPPANPRGLDIAGAVVGKADLAGHRKQVGDLPVYGGVGLIGGKMPAEEQVLERPERIRVQPGQHLLPRMAAASR